MSSRKTDGSGDISRELEIFRSQLEQDFLKESQTFEVKRRERLERLEEITLRTMETVDGEWEGLQARVIAEASEQRARAFALLDGMLDSLDRDRLISEVTQTALRRLLGEDERKDAGS